MNAFLWAVIAAMIWGVVPLIEKTGLAKAEPMPGLFYRSLGVLIGLLLLGLFMVKPQEIKSLDPRSIGFLVLGGFLASIVAQFCFYNSLKFGEVSRVVPIAGSFPMITFILGVLFFGESFTFLKASGVVLIVLGIWALKIG
ncbi:MAG: EamA family transporter [Candidatus Omnitrophota bacterium]